MEWTEHWLTFLEESRGHAAAWCFGPDRLCYRHVAHSECNGQPIHGSSSNSPSWGVRDGIGRSSSSSTHKPSVPPTHGWNLQPYPEAAHGHSSTPSYGSELWCTARNSATFEHVDPLSAVNRACCLRISPRLKFCIDHSVGRYGGSEGNLGSLLRTAGQPEQRCY